MSDIGNKEIFAKNLSFYMDKKKVDRYQLCDDLDFKYSTLCEWLSAKKYPRIDKIEKLANYFDIPKSSLIEEHSTTVENSAVDDVDIRRIQRAKMNMQEDVWERFMTIAKASFPDYFSDDYVDEDTDE
ncbi:MAG: helix-turn-helix transcriptional regulator [Oscillospiraceae bacterium]|nr:helix-turn-helix transcriptional regulator [Oscillospiraceae bacterium]